MQLEIDLSDELIMQLQSLENPRELIYQAISTGLEQHCIENDVKISKEDLLALSESIASQICEQILPK